VAPGPCRAGLSGRAVEEGLVPSAAQRANSCLVQARRADGAVNARPPSPRPAEQRQQSRFAAVAAVAAR